MIALTGLCGLFDRQEELIRVVQQLPLWQADIHMVEFAMLGDVLVDERP